MPMAGNGAGGDGDSHGEKGFSLVSILIALGLSFIAVALFNTTQTSFNAAGLQDLRRQSATSSLNLMKREIEKAITHQTPTSWDNLKDSTNTQAFTLISPKDYSKRYDVKIKTVCRKLPKDSLGTYIPEQVKTGIDMADDGGACLQNFKCRRGEKPSIRVTYEGEHGLDGQKKVYDKGLFPDVNANPNRDPLAMAVCFKWNGTALEATIAIEWLRVRDGKGRTYRTKIKSTRLIRSRPKTGIQLVP